MLPLDRLPAAHPRMPSPAASLASRASRASLTSLTLLAPLVALWLGACGQDVDLPWQLDHERVIAVRATPPRIASGQRAELDALLGRADGAPYEARPNHVEVVSPQSLASALSAADGSFSVLAPSAQTLAAARAELGLAEGAAVPLQLRVGFPGTERTALKVVWLGEAGENFALGSALVGGQEALAQDALEVLPETEVRLEVPFDASYNVNWLTSCGTMHDFDLARAYLRVEAADPQAGHLAVVVRDDRGAVAWRVWSIAAQPR